MKPDPFRRLSRLMCESLRRHLAEGARPRVPEAGVILWSCFADLCPFRRTGGGGHDPLDPAEIREWAGLRKMAFGPRHVQVIRDLDAVWLAHARGTAEPQALTPEGFDMVFG